MSMLIKIFSRLVNAHQQQIHRMSITTASGGGGGGVGGKVLLAVGQMRATNDKESNMQQVEELVGRAAKQNAKFLFLPECCDFVGENRKETLTLAETLSGPTMSRYKELAKCHNIWLSLGGVHELKVDAKGNETDKIYNAHVVLDSSGELVCVYRKLHLFDAQTKDFTLRESNTVAPGEVLVPPLCTPAGRLGLQICYDVRFPETGLLLRKMGAQLLTYPAAFTYSTGKAHWEILLRARAIETQCFVVAAAQQGWHNPKRQSWGHAMIISPWGKVLADCGGESELDVKTVEIDLDALEPIYQSMPCFEHRRNDIYSLTTYNLPLKKSFEQDRSFASNTIDRRTIFYESEHCFAFTNLRCVVEGHVLVSTKRITPRLNGLNCAEMTDLFATVCRVQRMLESIYSTTSATVTVQDGIEAGQTVPHVHFHIMPRRVGDFGHNDQIYVKLEDRVEPQPERTLQTRIDEAEKYRCYLQNHECA